jgi:hypothetical protein
MRGIAQAPGSRGEDGLSGQPFREQYEHMGVSNFCVTVDHKVSEAVGEDKLRAFCGDATPAATHGADVGEYGDFNLDLDV